MRDDVTIPEPEAKVRAYPVHKVREELTFKRFLNVLLRQWKVFLGVAILAFVLASIFSGPTFIEPRYRSTALVYPVNLTSYSIETRTDQLLQLLESNVIRDTIIARFDLVRAYKVDTSSLGGYFALHSEYDDRVDINKTRFESVQIQVVDEDPRKARDMVRTMLEQVDLLARDLQRDKTREVLEIARRAMVYEQQKLDSVETRLAAIRTESGVLDYENQARELTRGYTRLLADPRASAAQKNELAGMIRRLEEQGGEFRHLSQLSDLYRMNYDRLRTEFERVHSDMVKELTYTNVVVHPEVSDKKVYPIRWLIVSASVLSALFLCFILLSWREYRA